MNQTTEFNSTITTTAEANIHPATFTFGIVLGLIICFTILGNGLVITAVARFPRLRSVTNMFIVSLAIADVTVAVLVMPFSLIYIVVKGWSFGWVFCYFWVSCDVMCCTASILHLCVISLDRYLAITQPLSYKTKMSRLRASLLIACIWLCGCVVSFIPIYSGWFANTDNFSLYIDSPECGLFVNRIYAVVSSCTSFYLPLIVMILAYYKIYKIARKQASEIQKLEVYARDTGQDTDGGIERRSRKVARDRKAVKTLGTLMGLFIISWLPFFLMYLIMPFCNGCHLPPAVEFSITWLGYLNSLINPCVYAFLNRDFRMAFKRLLCCPKSQAGVDNGLEVANSADMGEMLRVNRQVRYSKDSMVNLALKSNGNSRHSSKDSSTNVSLLVRKQNGVNNQTANEYHV